MNLKAIRTEEINVDASDLEQQINDLSLVINNLPSYSFDSTELESNISNLNSKYSDLEKLIGDYIKFDTSTDSDFNESIGSIQKEIASLKEEQSKLSDISNRPIAALPVETKSTGEYVPSKFEFVLGVDEDGFSDTSWEEIIKKGQELQYSYWKAAEEKYNKIWKLFPGWHGSAMSPVINIICEEPEYHFKDTKRLPGRFCISSPSRWSSVLRFYGNGSKIVKDNIAYGVATNAPVGLYVEGKTKVKTSQGEMLMKPFEQTIEDVIICAHNGVLPIYLSTNQDRFCIRGCKILQHQGALIGIKHGPILSENNYPFDAIQSTEGNNVYLADPRFENLQMEGPHTNKRPQAAMLLSGNNIIISNLNLYGWMQGPYLHGGQNRLINGLTQHWGNTHDGRMYCSRDEIVSYTVSYKDNTKDSDCFSGIAGNFKQWYLPKRSKVPSRGGWHNFGESLL